MGARNFQIAAGTTPNAWITTMALVHFTSASMLGCSNAAATDRSACGGKEAESRVKVNGIDFRPQDNGVGQTPRYRAARILGTTMASAASPNASGQGGGPAPQIRRT
ncbi:hypothetical protein [Mesorhizobium sp.]|uniref:hypothetical protein n=1 Tax=Mesorhizobium sp. TaxID=1871066 RepID=UPI0025C2BB63|nr:hypothetical protein [Mesorhizobium sp.]